MEFEIVHAKARLAVDRGAQHLESYCGRRWDAVGLVWRDRSGNEDDLLEREFLQSFTRENQMSVVHGIKRPTVDADLAQGAKR